MQAESVDTGRGQHGESQTEGGFVVGLGWADWNLDL